MTVGYTCNYPFIWYERMSSDYSIGTANKRTWNPKWAEPIFFFVYVLQSVLQNNVKTTSTYSHNACVIYQAPKVPDWSGIFRYSGFTLANTVSWITGNGMKLLESRHKSNPFDVDSNYQIRCIKYARFITVCGAANAVFMWSAVLDITERVFLSLAMCVDAFNFLHSLVVALQLLSGAAYLILALNWYHTTCMLYKYACWINSLEPMQCAIQRKTTKTRFSPHAPQIVNDITKWYYRIIIAIWWWNRPEQSDGTNYKACWMWTLLIVRSILIVGMRLIVVVVTMKTTSKTQIWNN